MVDPWPIAISVLLGTHQVPDVTWPADRRRVIAARDWLDEDLPELAPEARTAATDERLLLHLAAAGRCSVRVAAAGAGLTRSTAERALQRLRAAGLVRLDGDGYAVA